MVGNLIPAGGKFFLVSEVNGTNETEHANYLAKSALKSIHGPVDVYAVFHDVGGKPDPLNGRFFQKHHPARGLFNAVQTDFEQYRNPRINGETLEQIQEWVDNLPPLDFQRIWEPGKYADGVVSLEYAGVQVVGDRQSLKLLELMGEDEELPEYKGNHDDYFCIKVDITQMHDEELAGYLYVKDRMDLIPVVDKLWDTFVDIQVLVSNTETLKRLMGVSEQEDASLPYADLVVGRTGGIIMYGRASDFNLLGISILPDRKVEEVFSDYHLAVKTSGHTDILFWVRDADLLAMLAQAITVVVKKSIVVIMEGAKAHHSFFDGTQQFPLHYDRKE
jgi:hypothetical protein